MIQDEEDNMLIQENFKGIMLSSVNFQFAELMAFRSSLNHC